MEATATRRLEVELPRYGVHAEITLHTRTASRLSELIWEALVTPLETVTGHAAFNGEELFCFLPPFVRVSELVVPPVEAWTMWPKPGDLMFFYKAPDERVSGGTEPIYEFCFMYGEADLRHFYEKGQVGSLVGHVSAGQDEFARACRNTRNDGQTQIIVRRG